MPPSLPPRRETGKKEASEDINQVTGDGDISVKKTRGSCGSLPSRKVLLSRLAEDASEPGRDLGRQGKRRLCGWGEGGRSRKAKGAPERKDGRVLAGKGEREADTEQGQTWSQLRDTRRSLLTYSRQKQVVG